MNFKIFLVFLIAIFSPLGQSAITGTNQNFQINLNTNLNVVEHLKGERIDGPANIRDSINGKILLSLNDNILVETSEIKNNWCRIGLEIKLSAEQISSYLIMPNSEIYSTNNEIIGMSIDTIPIWWSTDNSGFIGGYTYKNNIKPNSVPEIALSDVLKLGKKSRKDLAKFMLDFEFKPLDIFPIQNVNQFAISQSIIVDPSPRDRITLLFKNDILIAIVHNRKLFLNDYKTYNLIRGHKLTIVADLTNEEIMELKQSKIKLYNSID